MSVVLMRMKKVPENCCECELRQNDFDRGTEYCPFTGVDCLSIGRQANCHILAILPEQHGELVDRQAVYAKIKRWQEAAYDAFTIDMLHEFYVMLFTVPAIVPATERREE